MEMLIAGLILFFGLHFLPSFRTFRQSLINSLGEGKYKIMYSAVAATGLGLIIFGKMRAPFIELYQPVYGIKPVVSLMVLIGFYLFIGRRVGSNIKRFTAHPMLWGVSFWAGAHLLVNGDLASVLLFGSFLGFSFINMWLANRRGIVPVAVTVSLKKEALVILISIAVFALLLSLHGVLFGVNVLA